MPQATKMEGIMFFSAEWCTTDEVATLLYRRLSLRDGEGAGTLECTDKPSCEERQRIGTPICRKGAPGWLREGTTLVNLVGGGRLLRRHSDNRWCSVSPPLEVGGGPIRFLCE